MYGRDEIYVYKKEMKHDIGENTFGENTFSSMILVICKSNNYYVSSISKENFTDVYKYESKHRSIQKQKQQIN